MATIDNDPNDDANCCPDEIVESTIIRQMIELVDQLPSDDAESKSAIQDIAGCLKLLSQAWSQAVGSTGIGSTDSDEISWLPIESTPARSNRFEIRRLLGHGGFGVVLLAFDSRLGREVALKIPRPEVLVSRDMRRRFLREAQAAAALDHPNIVPVFDTGEIGPIWFIASGYVAGPTLAEWLRQQPSSLGSIQAAELVALLAAAVQHAHSRGVLHRDLKPANVLLQLSSQNDACLPFSPRLSDFGLARRLDEVEQFTRHDSHIGTPRYMAPEQAACCHKDVGVQTDIYGLGVILYELLTGNPPHAADTDVETLRRIIDEPVPISPLQQQRVPRDLQTICLKCLEKDFNRRYDTADALSADLKCFLSGEPIAARAVSGTERIIRWCRRRPLQAALCAALCMVSVVGIAGITWQWLRAERSLTVAKTQTSRAEESLRRLGVTSNELAHEKHLAQAGLAAAKYERYLVQIGFAAAKIDENSFDFAMQILQQCEPELRNWEWRRLVHLCQLATRSYQATGRVNSVAYSPDGLLFITGDQGGHVTLRDSSTGKVRWQGAHGPNVLSVAFSSDGEYVATGSSDKIIKILKAADGQEVKTLSGHTDGVFSVRFSPDGRQLLSGSYDKTARLWDVVKGKLLQELRGHSGWVWAAEFSPDANRIVTASQDGKAIVWQRQSLADENMRMPGGAYTRQAEFTEHAGAIYSARFSPDGKLVATGGYDSLVMIWNPDKIHLPDIGQRLKGQPEPKSNCVRLVGHERAVRSVAFSPNGKLLVSSSADNTIRVWDLAGGEAAKSLRGHGAAVSSCVFSPNGKTVLSAGDDQSIRIWNVQGYQENQILHATIFAGHEDAVLSARFSADGKRVVTASRDRTASLWDVASGKPLRRFTEGHEFLVANAVFFPDKRHLATEAGDNSVRVWNLNDGTQTTVLTPTGRSSALAVSPDGQYLATGSQGSEALLWDVRFGKVTTKLAGHSTEISAVAFSPKGDRLATGDFEGHIQLWKRGDNNGLWSSERSFIGHTGSISALRFTTDGARLITASSDRTCAQWDVTSGEELSKLGLSHPDSVSSLDLSADGKLALTACDDGIARLWRLADAKQIAFAKPSRLPFNSVCFSPDNNAALLTSAEEKRVFVWDISSAKDAGSDKAATLDLLFDFNKFGGEVWTAMFTPDGTNVLTLGGNEAQLFSLESHKKIVRYNSHGVVSSAAMSPDGRLVATGGWDHCAKIWDATTGRAIYKLDGGHTGQINSVEFSPDGVELLTASDDGTARIWNVETGRPADIVLRGHRGRVLAATYSPDGKRVLTVSDDKTAQVWDRMTGKQLIRLSGHAWSVLCGRFSSDGKRVITGSQDNIAKIWDAITGRALIELKGHTAAVTSVAFSPDGTRALTGGHDNFIRVWDAATGKEVLSLSGHTQEVTSVSFSPDGRNVLSSSRDGIAIIWLATDGHGAQQSFKEPQRVHRHSENLKRKSQPIAKEFALSAKIKP